jgi:hypothetical protein
MVKRWDDLQILKSIDELAGTEAAALFSGYTLMQKLRPVTALDPQPDPRGFAHELVLASQAGLLEFTKIMSGQDYDWRGHPEFWLQQIGNISLTIEGRVAPRAALS